MNKDQIEGKWTEIKGQLQEAYGDLTQDELEEAKGNRTQLEGVLQQKTGNTKEEIRETVDRILAKV